MSGEEIFKSKYEKFGFSWKTKAKYRFGFTYIKLYIYLHNNVIDNIKISDIPNKYNDSSVYKYINHICEERLKRRGRKIDEILK